jgi:hypothetical protein
MSAYLTSLSVAGGVPTIQPILTGSDSEALSGNIGDWEALEITVFIETYISVFNWALQQMVGRTNAGSTLPDEHNIAVFGGLLVCLFV